MRKFLVSIATIAALVIFADAASARTFALNGTFGKALVKKRCGAAYEEAGGKYGCAGVPCKGGTCAVSCEKGKCTGKVPTAARVTSGAPSTSGPKDALEAALMGIEPAKNTGAAGGKNFTVPMSGGLLDADRGMPSGGGPAPTGAPAAPAAPAGRIN